VREVVVSRIRQPRTDLPDARSRGG
jgi:hypothetical protein